MSCRMTTLAEVRFMPRPPARVDSRKTKMSVSVLNSSISTILQKKKKIYIFLHLIKISITPKLTGYQKQQVVKSYT